MRIRNATADVPMTVSYLDVQSGRTRIIDTIRPRSISTVTAPAGSVRGPERLISRARDPSPAT